jgi:hypothetical protein
VTLEHPTTVALQRRLTSPDPRTAAGWCSVLERLVAGVAEGCDDAGALLIGHIKAFAALADGYVRASAVDATHPPTSEARASAPATGIDLTVNVLVYGLPDEAARRVAEDSLARLAADDHITIGTIG